MAKENLNEGLPSLEELAEFLYQRDAPRGALPDRRAYDKWQREQLADINTKNRLKYKQAPR